MRNLLIVALALLLAAALVQSSSPVVYSQLEAAHTDMATLRLLMERLKLRDGRLPDKAIGLRALVAHPQLLEKLPSDPWGHEYVYRLAADSAGYVIYSVGPDGVDSRGAGDDMTDRSKPNYCQYYNTPCRLNEQEWLVLAGSAAFLAASLAISFWLIRRVQRGAA